MDQGYSPVIETSQDEQSLSAKDCCKIDRNTVYKNQKQRNDRSSHSLFDSSILLEEESTTTSRARQGFTEKEIEESLGRLIENVQQKMEAVANDPRVQEISDSTQNLILAQCQDEDDVISIRSIENPKKKDRSFDSTAVDPPPPCLGCNVFSPMEHFFDNLDEECAELNDSNTTRSEKSDNNNTSKIQKKINNSSPSDVRYFDPEPLDSSLETYDTDQTVAMMPVSRKGRRHSVSTSTLRRLEPQLDDATTEKSDDTPCQNNFRRNHMKFGEPAYEKPPKPCIGVKRFWGRKLRMFQCHEHSN